MRGLQNAGYLIKTKLLQLCKSVSLPSLLSQVEKQKADLMKELDELQGQLEEEGGMKTAQVCLV